MNNTVKICYDDKVIIPYIQNIIISVEYAGIVSELVPAYGYHVISLFILISTSELDLQDFSVKPVSHDVP